MLPTETAEVADADAEHRRLLPPHSWDDYDIEQFCKNDTEDTLVASPRSCQHYFDCSTGREGVCPDGLLFNEESQKCDVDHGMGCVLCPKSGEHAFADPRACNYIYYCSNGMRYRLECPKDYRYDEEWGGCRPRHKVQCSVKDICRYQGSLGGLFLVGDPNDCQK